MKRWLTILTPIVTISLLILVLGLVDAKEDKIIVLMWQVHPNSTQNELNYLSKQGVTLIQSFRTIQSDEKVVGAFLNRAKKAGLGVVIYMGSHIKRGSSCYYAKKSLDFLKKYRAHSGIAAWHLLDEPAGKDISKKCQQELYRSIKNIDPITPVMLSTNNNTKLKYKTFFTEDAFDILEMHYYVNPYPVKGHQNLLNFFLNYHHKTYPVIITLRAFNSNHKKGRVPMVQGSLLEQYDFFIKKAGITYNYGFYGWDLSPNKGIKQNEVLRTEFELFMLHH